MGCLAPLLSLLLVFSSAWALDVQPQRLELTIDPEEPTPGTIEVVNRSAKAVNVRISTGAYRFFQPGLRIPSAQTWFAFEPREFTLAAESSSRVSYTITPPFNVRQDTAGEYLAAVLVDELPAPQDQATHADSPEPSSVTIVPRFAMPVYLNIRGKELTQVEATEIHLEETKPPGLLRAQVTLENRGSVHVRPTGTVAILNDSGEVIQVHPIGKAIPLLPSATLEIPTVVPMPPPGKYRAVLTVEAGTGNILHKETPFEVGADGKIR